MTLDELTTTQRDWRDHCIAYLRERYPHHSGVVDEYIEGAEHQEGYTYWSLFGKTSELNEDFDLYFANRSGIA